MKILICGGGIAGLTLAWWLHHYGFEPIVIEKASAFARIGYMLGLRATGVRVLEKMGLIEAAEAYRVPLKFSNWIDGQGNLLKQFSFDEFIKITESLPINRADLHHVLWDAVRAKVTVRFNCTIREIQQTVDAVQVTFDDSTIETYDLLIGADGFDSITRRT